MNKLLVLGSLAMLLAACGTAAPAASKAPAAGSGGRPTTLAEIAAYQGADRQAILEEGAKKEGTVQYYTTLAGDVIQAITDRFHEKYPFLKIETYRGNGDELMTKISQEQAAKKYIVDVIHGDEDTVAQIGGAGFYVPFYSPNAAAFPADDRDAASGALNYDVLNTVLYMSFGYNTKSLPESLVPKTYADLANPALKGKMAITGTGNSGPRLIGTIIGAYNEDLVHKIAQQSFQVQMVAAKAVSDLISKGEIISSPTIYEDHAQQAAEAGAPVKWVPLEPVVGGFSGVGVVQGAQHPYASMLLLDYMLSPDFRKIQDDYHLGNPSVNPGFKTARPTKGMNLNDRSKAFEHWAALLKEFGR